MTLRDELGLLYTDRHFAPLFAPQGPSAQSPGQLALVTVLQFAEGLSDRQAAEAGQALFLVEIGEVSGCP